MVFDSVDYQNDYHAYTRLTPGWSQPLVRRIFIKKKHFSTQSFLQAIAILLQARAQILITFANSTAALQCSGNCTDGIRNGLETGIDTGGFCGTRASPPTTAAPKTRWVTNLSGSVVGSKTATSTMLESQTSVSMSNQLFESTPMSNGMAVEVSQWQMT